MTLSLRQATPGDLISADALVVGSINQLTEAHGFGSIAQPSPPRLQRFSLTEDPDGLWVAEEDGRMVGFGFSWTNEDFWFLAQLFVVPDHQGGGVGRQLLARTLDHAAKTGARARALITFAFNRVSQGLYLAHGLYPVCPLYSMSGPRESFLNAPTTTTLRRQSIALSQDHLDELETIDRAALGFSRAKHHRYLLGDGGLQGVLFRSGDECVGYAYAGDGHVGPIAVHDSQFADDVIQAALSFAAETTQGKVSALVPGTNRAALGIAVQHQMRITLPMLLMADGDLQDWSRYVPRTPGFM